MQAAYVFNGKCGCVRCRSKALMAPAILITLGIVFLSGRVAYLVPAILIVVGVVKILQGNAPAEGHVNPPLVAVAAAPVYVQQPQETINPSDPSAVTKQEEFHG